MTPLQTGREWQKSGLKQISTETMQIVTSEWQKLLDYSPIDCGDFINVGSILSRLDSSSVFTNIGKELDLFCTGEEIYTI
jgi:hypothetical protein